MSEEKQKMKRKRIKKSQNVKKRQKKDEEGQKIAVVQRNRPAFSILTMTKDKSSFKTHVNMDGFLGGCYRIDNATLLNELYNKMASAFVSAGCSYEYLAEFPTKVINFSLDIDVSVDDGKSVPQQFLDIMFSTIYKVVTAAWPDEDHQMIVASQEAWFRFVQQRKEISEKNASRTRSNYHVHFPNIQVSQDKGIYIAGCIAAVLKKTYPLELCDFLKAEKRSWDQIIDGAIYNSGLRMITSSKCKLCKCHSLQCNVCEGKQNRKEDLQKGYLPDFVYPSKKRITFNKKDKKLVQKIVKYLHWCSIRTNKGESQGFVDPGVSIPLVAGVLPQNKTCKSLFLLLFYCLIIDLFFNLFRGCHIERE